MGSFFRIDGPFYRFGNIIYYLLVYNILWVVFSLPIFTIGASTTALFYVMGKVVRDEDFSTFKDFWKSFRTNFKQSTIITLILGALYLILYVDLKYAYSYGNIAKYMLPIQFAVLIELVFVTLYIFPVLSRFNIDNKNLFKTALFMSNRHILSTITCVGMMVIIGYVMYRVPSLSVLMPFSLCALAVSYVLNGVFKKYIPESDDSEDDEGEWDGEHDSAIVEQEHIGDGDEDPKQQ